MEKFAQQLATHLMVLSELSNDIERLEDATGIMGFEKFEKELNEIRVRLENSARKLARERTEEMMNISVSIG